MASWRLGASWLALASLAALTRRFRNASASNVNMSLRCNIGYPPCFFAEGTHSIAALQEKVILFSRRTVFDNTRENPQVLQVLLSQPDRAVTAPQHRPRLRKGAQCGGGGT